MLEKLCSCEDLEFYITNEIKDEIQKGRADLNTVNSVFKMINTGKLKISPITNYNLYNLLISNLGAGEASGIALAYENDGYFFASEDETARLEAIDILKSSDLVLGLNELLDFAINKKLVAKKEVNKFFENLELFN